MTTKWGTWVVVLALILILGRFTIQTHARTITNSNSANGDQLAYLQLGLDLKEAGTLTDGTRHPLYPAFLATFASREWFYFTWAKLLSVFFGAGAILAVFLLGYRLFNLITGLIAAYLLSINAEFIIHSATALTESLLVLVFTLAWFAVVAAMRHQDKLWLWSAAGSLIGLAVLAKGSGQLLLIATLLTTILIYRRAWFKTTGVWLLLASFAVVTSPLWIYNVENFGSPTFNYAITHQMWMDEWSDWHPETTESLPTVFSYLQDHSLPDALERQWQGMRALRNIVVKTLWPTRSLGVDNFLLSPLSSIVLLGILLLPVIFWRASRTYLNQNSAAVTLTLSTGLIFYLLFAWYVPIVPLGQRFLLPLIPFVFILVAHIFSLLINHLSGAAAWAKPVVTVALTLLILHQARWAFRTSLTAGQTLISENLFEHDRLFFASASAPLEWLSGEPEQVRNVAWGPAGKSLPTWAYSDRLNFQHYPPNSESLAALNQALVKKNAHYIIVAPEMIDRHTNLPPSQLAVSGDALALNAIPTGWALAYADQMPCRWCIFRLLANHPPGVAMTYQVGNAIELVGYDLPQTRYRQKDTIPLTLHWRATGVTGQGFTVFTQLLGPDHQIYGQLDRPPLNGLWPTGRWQTGDRLADRFDIPIEPDAPPGDYRLVVGLYDPATGQRLPIALNGILAPDEAIIVTNIRIDAAEAALIYPQE